MQHCVVIQVTLACWSDAACLVLGLHTCPERRCWQLFSAQLASSYKHGAVLQNHSAFSICHNHRSRMRLVRFVRVAVFHLAVHRPQ